MVNKILLKQLLRNWNKNHSIIIAVDFDDTLRAYHIDATEQCKNVIDTLKRAQKVLYDGCKIVIYTARENTNENTNYMWEWCNKFGIEIAQINQNVIDWYKGSKLFYNILLDDRSGLNEALETLNIFLDLINEEVYEA